MANEFFNASGYPAPRVPGASASMRSELAAIGQAFDKFPGIAGQGLKVLRVNAAGTAIEAVAASATGAVMADGSVAMTGQFDIATASQEFMTATSPRARGTGGLYSQWYDPTGVKGFFGYGSGVNDTLYLWNSIADKLSFGTSNVERMVVTAGGDVTIGRATANWATSGRACLEIEGASSAIYGMHVGGVAMGYLYHNGTTLKLTNLAAGAIDFETNGGVRRGYIDYAGYMAVTASYYAAITSLGNNTAPFRVEEVTVPSGSLSHTPALQSKTVLTGVGYVGHLSIGQYRNGTDWSGGIYMAYGGNDAYPTSAWYFRNDGAMFPPNNNLTLAGYVNASRFYTGYDSGEVNSFSCNNWFRTNGGTGLYFSASATGVGPPQRSYGSMASFQAKNSYYGVEFGNLTLMCNASGAAGDSGIYSEYYGGWWIYTNNNLDLHVRGNVVAYSSSISDRKLKKDIEPIRGALNKLLAITGVTYKLIADDKPGTGVIAQDVQAVFPDLVTEVSLPKAPGDESEAPKVLTVAYGQLVGPIIEALREINDRLKALEAA